jgi:hypothetical protein
VFVIKRFLDPITDSSQFAEVAHESLRVQSFTTEGQLNPIGVTVELAALVALRKVQKLVRCRELEALTNAEHV